VFLILSSEVPINNSLSTKLSLTDVSLPFFLFSFAVSKRAGSNEL
jgi:hypothetical protein